MASTRNQLQFDSISAIPPLHSLHESARLPQSNTEDLRTTVHRLQFELDSLKQSASEAKIAYEADLRRLTLRAEEEVRQAQALTAATQTHAEQYDSLSNHVAVLEEATKEDQEQSSRRLQKAEEERRAAEEENDELREQLEDAQRNLRRELDESRRAADQLRADLSAHQELNLRLQSELQEMKDIRSQNQEAVTSLESEITQLKAKTDGIEALTALKTELAGQIKQIQKLEAVNLDQVAELERLRPRQEAADILEEKNLALHAKLDALPQLQKQLGDLRLQKQILDDERRSWTAYLSDLPVEPAIETIDSPEALAKAYVRERLARVTLLDELGKVRTSLEENSNTLQAMREQHNNLHRELEDAKKLAEMPKDSVAARLGRRNALMSKEVEYLRAQVQVLNSEEPQLAEVQLETAEIQRLRELEQLVEQYHKEVQALHGDLERSKKEAATVDLPDKGAKRAFEHEDDERLGEQLRRNRALQAEMADLENAKTLLEKELSVQKEQIQAVKARSSMRILELRSNPTARAEAVKMSVNERLREENSALLARLESSDGAVSGRKRAKEYSYVPQATIDRLRAEMAEKDTALLSNETYIARVKQKFGTMITEWREAVLSVLGWKIDFMPNGRLRVTSAYYPGSSGEDDDHSIVFDSENGTMKVSGGPRSAFANELRPLIEFWVDGRKDIPCFLAACTMEFWEKTTRAQKI